MIWLSDMMYNYDKRKNYGIDKIKKGGVIMAHVAKYTQVQTGHLFNHYNRDKEKDCNRSNQDIDKSKTHENYNLMQREEFPQEYFKSRLDQLYKIDRADVKVCVIGWSHCQRILMAVRENFSHTLRTF